MKLFNTLPKPKSQLMEVLYLLLSNNYPLSRKFFMDKAYILNITANISVLRERGVGIITNDYHVKNKFGRAIRYSAYSLGNINKAKEFYKSNNV